MAIFVMAALPDKGADGRWRVGNAMLASTRATWRTRRATGLTVAPYLSAKAMPAE
jgi:hypothetical protein